MTNSNVTNFDDFNDFSGFQQKCMYCQNNGCICAHRENKTSLCEREYCPRFECPSTKSVQVKTKEPSLFFVKQAFAGLQKIEQALALINGLGCVNMFDIQVKMLEERDRLILNDINYKEAWEILCLLGTADRKTVILPDKNDCLIGK
jgi:hypothetical protein